MASNKKIYTFAKQLLIHSLDSNGLVSSKRVQDTLQTLKRKKPTNLLPILRAYKLQVSQKIKYTTALIEYAGSPTNEQIKSIQSLLTQKYRRNIQIKSKETPSIIAGIKISVADDVYELSVNSRLQLLAKSV